MNYLNRLYRLVSITAILLLLLSCDSTLPQSREDVRSATNTVVSPSTTITSSVIPTATVSAFHMPRWTPWPKLPTEEILQAALTIYENNGGCQFPCVWGVTPGQTSLRSVHERFSPLSTKDSVTLSYNDVAHPHAVLTKGNNSYTYDATGNQTQRIIGTDTYDLTYDAENRLKEVKKNTVVIATFLYDGLGNRVLGAVNGVTTAYISDQYEYNVTNAVKRSYYGAIAMRVDDGTNNDVYFVLKDHLGSTSVTLNTNGVVTSELRYDSFGETRYSFGSTPTTKRYTGQREEIGIGLYFYNSRWYDPAIGRFTQADTIVPDKGDPQSFDRYGYTLNNPMRYTDPSGHITCPNPNASCAPTDGDVYTPGSVSPPIIFLGPVINPGDLQWVQFYGNTLTAYNGRTPLKANSPEASYYDFAQGMHPGIDLGAAPGTPIYAGVYGTVISVCPAPDATKNDCTYSPGWVRIKLDPEVYPALEGEVVMIFYGHVEDIKVKGGDYVTPETQIGVIDTSKGSLEHVHIEVWVGNWGPMTNPLVYFPPHYKKLILTLGADQRESCATGGNQCDEGSFYSGIDYWQSPYSQPDILRTSGKLVPDPPTDDEE